jgi:hypothetical protein
MTDVGSETARVPGQHLSTAVERVECDHIRGQWVFLHKQAVRRDVTRP